MAKLFDLKCAKTILVLAWPLILSTCSSVIQQYVDKIFLAQYSQEALAACVPAGMVACVITCFFTGTLGYISNFVSQYLGAEEKNKIPIVMYQALLLAVVFSLMCACACFLGKFLFVNLARHNLSLAKLEIEYYNPSMWFAFLALFNTAVGSFFVGIKKTNVVLQSVIIATIVNIIFDYIFIFGKFSFPEMGLKGAAYATALGQFAGFIYNFSVYYSTKFNKEYNTRGKAKFDYKELKKLIHYGLPSGIQATMDFFIWTCFILLIGKFSVTELAASNIAFQVDQIAFMPILGIGMAVSIIISNELGKDKHSFLNLGLTIKSAMVISGFYNVFITVLFVFLPKILIMPFCDFDHPDPELVKIASILLKMMALYVIFDSFGIVLVSVLRGAGDTYFIMWSMFISGLICIVFPAFIALKIHSLYFAWWGAVIYIFVIFLIFLIRVKQGKWKKIKIIA